MTAQNSAMQDSTMQDSAMQDNAMRNSANQNNAAQNKMEAIHPRSKWREMTVGGMILASGNSAGFKTGDWRTVTPVTDWDKCRQCLLCAPVCPDSSIPVKDGKRLEFDGEHCKGCGICAKVCPSGAIAFGAEEE